MSEDVDPTATTDQQRAAEKRRAAAEVADAAHQASVEQLEQADAEKDERSAPPKERHAAKKSTAKKA